MRPEDLAEQLKTAVGPGLKSVILYGSAAAGDHTGRKSNFNVLVVVDRLSTEELRKIGGPAVRWTRAGNPPPLLFTLDRLRQSADVFPIELLDIRECHRMLHGEDVTEGLELSHANLRMELEHELKGKLIQLRENYLLTEGRKRRVADLLVESLSTFLVLFRAVLRLYRREVPQRKMEALHALAEHISVDRSVFETILALKDGTRKARDVDVEAVFARYLTAVESVADAVDAQAREGTGGRVDSECS